MRWGIALLTASVRRATARASPLSLQRNDGPWEFDLAPASADDIVPLDAPSLGASPSPKLTVVWAPGHTLGSVVAHYTSAARGEGVLFSGHLVGGARTAAMGGGAPALARSAGGDNGVAPRLDGYLLDSPADRRRKACALVALSAPPTPEEASSRSLPDVLSDGEDAAGDAEGDAAAVDAADVEPHDVAQDEVQVPV